jgi:hypothetical protein
VFQTIALSLNSSAARPEQPRACTIFDLVPKFHQVATNCMKCDHCQVGCQKAIG